MRPMTPIEVDSRLAIPLPSQSIAAQILETENWRKFQGYGPIPGIASAEFELRTPEVVGSRIRVKNRDKSSHVEEIVEWVPSERLLLRMSEFSAPLGWFADHFEELWRFEPAGDETLVVRTIRLFPGNAPGKLLLRLISPLLRGAIDRHLRQIRQFAIDAHSAQAANPAPRAAHAKDA